MINNKQISKVLLSCGYQLEETLYKKPVGKSLYCYNPANYNLALLVRGSQKVLVWSSQVIDSNLTIAELLETIQSFEASTTAGVSNMPPEDYKGFFCRSV